MIHRKRSRPELAWLGWGHYNVGMTDTPLPPQIWETLTPEAQAAVLTLVGRLEQRITELTQQIQDLKARLDQNSTDSSRPPSTDPIGVKRKPPAPPSKGRRGGQKG